MILVNESKRVLVLSAPGYQDLYIKKDEVFSFEHGLYYIFEDSIKTLMSINDKIKIYSNDDWSKLKTKETPIEKKEDKEAVEAREKSAMSEFNSAKKAVDTMPEDAHHKTKFAAEKRLLRAKKRLESFK